MAIEIKRAGFDQFFSGGDKYRILLFGDPAAGKTPWAAQMPKPIFLAADRSAPASLAMSQTDYIEIHSEKAALDALTYLRRESTRPSFEYETVVIDTFSVLQSHISHELMRRMGLKSMDGFDAWGDLGASMSRILDAAMALDMNLVVNVHMKTKFDASSKSTIYEPDLVGSTKVNLPKEFPFIGWIKPEWEVNSGGGSDDAPVSREVVRRVFWRATPTMPLLRSPSSILDVTTADFKPTDFTQITDAFGAAMKDGLLKAVNEATSSVRVVKDEEAPAPAELPGGPVEPDLSKGVITKPRVPKAKAGEVATPKEEPEQTPAGAQQLVQEELGGEVVAEEVDWLTDAKAAKSVAAVRKIWNEAAAAKELTSELKAELTIIAGQLKEKE